jgi:hypothetical protein
MFLFFYLSSLPPSLSLKVIREMKPDLAVDNPGGFKDGHV